MLNSSAFKLGDKKIGGNARCLIIAEIGINHNGSYAMAIRMIDAAKEAGADAVKFQTFSTDALVTKSAKMAAYQQKNTKKKSTQWDLLKKCELNALEFKKLKAYCDRVGIIFLSTPFDIASAKLLKKIGVAGFKIPSGEVTNRFLLEEIGRFKVPVILSTGMSNLSEVERAIRWLQDSGCSDLALLHCVSNYPAHPRDLNLKAMETMRQAFGIPVGYSDHTLGIVIPSVAVGLGACIIEKHFTLDVNMPGPDHKASLEPDEFKKMKIAIREVEVALGHGRKEAALSEMDTAKVARKSLVAAKNLPKGHQLTAKDIAVKRPGTGLEPDHFELIVGRKLKAAVQDGDLLTLKDLI